MFLDPAGCRFTPGLALGEDTLVVEMVEGVLVDMVEESVVGDIKGTLESREEDLSRINSSCELLGEIESRIIETGDGLNIVVPVETCGVFTAVIEI